MSLDFNPPIDDPWGTNDPVPGMRVGRFDDQQATQVVNSNFTWNGAQVTSTPTFFEKVPPVGSQFQQQSTAQARPIKVGTDR